MESIQITIKCLNYTLKIFTTLLTIFEKLIKYSVANLVVILRLNKNLNNLSH